MNTNNMVVACSSPIYLAVVVSIGVLMAAAAMADEARRGPSNGRAGSRFDREWSEEEKTRGFSLSPSHPHRDCCSRCCSADGVWRELFDREGGGGGGGRTWSTIWTDENGGLHQKDATAAANALESFCLSQLTWYLLPPIVAVYVMTEEEKEGCVIISVIIIIIII